MIAKKSDDSATRVGFLLLDNFSMLAFSSAIEPLRMANQLSGDALYSWATVTENGEPVTCSNGINFQSDYSVATLERYDAFDAVFVCGGLHVHRLSCDASIQWLKSLAKSQVVLGLSLIHI